MNRPEEVPAPRAYIPGGGEQYQVNKWLFSTSNNEKTYAEQQSKVRAEGFGVRGGVTP